MNLTFRYIFSILLIIQNTSFGAVLPKAGCTISVNEHFTDPQPLLLYQNKAVEDIKAFPIPEDSAGTLNFNKGESFDIACPGSSVVVDGIDLSSNLVEAKCSSGIKFTIQGKSVAFNTVSCKKSTVSIARYSGKKCATSHKEIEIGFEVNKRFIKHIITCFDENLQHALYAKNVISSGIKGTQVNYPRPGFQVGTFYDVKPDKVPTLYTQNRQRKTINAILGRKESDESIIQPKTNFYLATGHYTPKGDYIYGAQQRLTFYYVNAAPQWQSFNAGNWNTMEANVRGLAVKKNVDFVVYTGSHGISTLPDVDGNEQKLYLWTHEKNVGIPVPAIYFKVVYEPKSQAGIALVGLNNPYKKDVKSDVICKDVCDQVNWLTWKSKNLTLGYAYCCQVDDLRKTITTLPPFKVKSLLK